MGYALFTARKLSLQTQVNNYNLQLAQLESKKKQLTQKQANFNRQQYLIDAKQGQTQAALFRSQCMNTATSQAGKEMGNFGLIGKIVGLGVSAGSSITSRALDKANSANNIKDLYTDAKQAADENEFNTQMTNEQNYIDAEKGRIETLLKQAQTELDAVKQQEDKAIEKSTPKYCA